MSDYIKRKDAKQLFLNHMGSEFPQSIKEQIVEKAFEEVPPSADVAEVVRCKDCIHNDQCKHRVVMWVEDPINTWHKDIDFCSYGERKEK